MRMMLLFAVTTALLWAQGLTVQKVAAMAEAGLAEDLLLQAVKRENRVFDLSADDLIILKKAKVPDSVIRAMMSPGAGGGGTSAGAPVNPLAGGGGGGSFPNPGSANTTPAAFPTETGVYVNRGGEWVEVLPEVVNWKTGGVLKSIGTVGIIKGDVNGLLVGVNSRNTAKTPLEFVIVAPDGTSITEYQFIRLRVNKEGREFRTVTGGVLHSKGGAMRDVVLFEGKKVAPRTFLVQIPSNIGVGEYGFLPPATGAGNSGGALNKMYTFRYLE